MKGLLQGTPRSVLEPATVRALRKTMLWLKFEASKDLSGELGVKLSLIRNRFRILIRRGVRTEGEVTMIADAIPAILLGVTPMPHGVKTGVHPWSQGFVAEWHKLRRHPQRVWQRLTRERLPIAEAKIPVAPTAEGLMESYASRAQARFLANLEHELSWALRRWR